MPRFVVPFEGAYSLEESSPRFHPGIALVEVASKLEDKPGQAWEGTVETPWGTLEAERRDRGILLVGTPRHDVDKRPVMMQAACQSLGLDPGPVEATGAQMRVVDVGRRVLVVPFQDEESLRQAPDEADASRVPGHDAEEGVGYVHTQTTPYARIVTRSWGALEPLAGLAAAGVHLISSGLMRPTYPRTRIVVSRIETEDEEAEVTVQARKAGGEPVLEHVLVGGAVERVE